MLLTDDDLEGSPIESLPISSSSQETNSFVTCFTAFQMPFCLQLLLLLLANLVIMILVAIQIYKRIKISMSLFSKKLNLLYMIAAQTILFEIQNIYRPVKQTYYILYWIQNIYYCYLIYYFCLKVLKSYQEDIIFKKKHIRIVLFIFWTAYTGILLFNFINEQLNPTILCKQAVFGYTRGINFILTLGFIILGKLLQKRVDTILIISGVEDESVYNKQMNNIWSLIKWSLCGQFFNLIGTFYLILNEYHCEFVPYNGYENYSVRVYLNSLVVILYRISSYFIFIIAPLRAFWFNDYMTYTPKEKKSKSSYEEENGNTFFRGLGHKRLQNDVSVSSNLEDPMLRGDQSFAKPSYSFSPYQGASTPYLNKSEDLINLTDDYSQRNSRFDKQKTNVEVTESRVLMF